MYVFQLDIRRACGPCLAALTAPSPWSHISLAFSSGSIGAGSL